MKNGIWVVFLILSFPRAVLATETSATLSEEALLAGVKYYDSRLRSCPLFFKVRFEQALPRARDKSILTRYGLYHEYAYEETKQYYRGAQWDFDETTGDVTVTTRTVVYDGKKSIERDIQTAGRFKSEGVAVYGENRIMGATGTPISGLFPSGATTIDTGLLSYYIEKKRYDKLMTSTDRLAGRECVKLTVLVASSSREHSRRDYWIDPKVGFRTVRLMFSVNGRIDRIKTYYDWTEVQKDVFIPLRCHSEMNFLGPGETNPHTVRDYYVEEIKAGKDLPREVFNVKLQPGTHVWDNRFQIGYKVGADGRILEPEELLNLKKTQSGQ
jgi:hypothetical protein